MGWRTMRTSAPGKAAPGTRNIERRAVRDVAAVLAITALAVTAATACGAPAHTTQANPSGVGSEPMAGSTATGTWTAPTPTASTAGPDVPSPTPPATPAPATTHAPAPAGTVLWRGDPGLGTRIFDGLEPAPGKITVADDPQQRFGPSWRYETWDTDGGTERCESRGLRRPDGSVVTIGTAQEGQTFYLGWRSLWSLPPASPRWISLFQLHVSGVSADEPNVGPFVLRTLGDGQLHFQLESPDGSNRHIWNAPLSLDTWNSFVIGFRLARSNTAGWVEFWYNGVRQTFANGDTRYYGATLWGTHVNVKWGVYRSGPNDGHAVAYLNHPVLGTSYAAVAL